MLTMSGDTLSKVLCAVHSRRDVFYYIKDKRRRLLRSS
jgi:hypothetical protein